MAAKLRSRLLVPHQRDSAISHEASAAINDVFQGRVILDLKDKKFDKGSILSPPFLRCSRCIGWFYNGRLQSFQVAYNHLEVFSMDEQVREALLADRVRRESISPMSGRGVGQNPVSRARDWRGQRYVNMSRIRSTCIDC